MNSIIINFQEIKIKVTAPIKHIKLIKEYFPLLTYSNSKCYKYEIEIILNNKLDFTLPEKFLVKTLFSGQTYFIWKDKMCINGFAQESKNCARHFIKVTGRKFIIQVPFIENINYIICIIREILLKELLSSGYIPVHASAIVFNEKTYCFFGAKNSGKSICFFSAVNNGAAPLSNDLVFIKKVSGKWIAVGWPFAPSISKKFFNSNYTGDEKIKFTPQKFCEIYHTSWIWQCELKNLIYVKFKENEAAKLIPLDSKKLEGLMGKYAKEDRWIWEDTFGLGENFQDIKYTELSNEIQGRSLTGNIIKLFESLKGESYG